MGRAKMNLELIESNKIRHSTFHKRKNGLKKKVSELSTLCGVKVAMIIYSPTHYEDSLEPDIWPANHDDVRNLITKYHNQSPGDRKKRTTDLSSFLEDRKKKAMMELEKTRKANEEVEVKYPTWDIQFDDLQEEQLRQIRNFLDQKLEEAKDRLQQLQNYNFSSQQQCAYNYLQHQSMLRRARSMELEQLKVNNMFAYSQPYNYPQGLNLVPNPRMMDFTGINDYYVSGLSSFPYRSTHNPPPPPAVRAEPVAYNYDDATMESINNLNNHPHNPPSAAFRAEPVSYNYDDAMIESVNYLKNLISAPPMRFYNGEPMQQALPEYYTPVPLQQALPEYYTPVPFQARAMDDDDYEYYVENGDLKKKIR